MYRLLHQNRRHVVPDEELHLLPKAYRQLLVAGKSVSDADNAVDELVEDELLGRVVVLNDNQ